MDFVAVLYQFVPLVAASSNEDNSAAYLPLLLLVSGFLYYFWQRARYRNADKRHLYEKETNTAVQNMQQFDQLAKHRRGLSNAKMHGANQDRIEGTLNKEKGIAKALKTVSNEVSIR